MMYISLAITVIAAFITTISFLSGKKLKKLIISEKNMIQDKVADIKTLLQKHIDIVVNDRSTYKDSTRNSITIRIEEFQSIIKNLERFESRLKSIK